MMGPLCRYLLALAILIVGAGQTLAQERVVTSEDCLPGYLDLDTLKRLVEAKNVTALDSAHGRAQFPDAAIEVVYAAHRQKLRPGPATDEALLRALPRNHLEFWFVYALTSPENGLPSEVSDLAYEYYADAAAAVVRTGRHYLEYLRLSELALSGEMLDILQGHNEELYRASPKRFQSAVRLLSALGRNAACGESIPCSERAEH